ncbi:hypothetical protein [Natronobacterium gregoryi]|uniref:DUF4267 domain-containing protein n=2 Tax=Natronobacterium gregoryi TaxID=44930 RepID=L0AHU3_NATGS|nr:hypothetical protein [Natronobacterium gregoryi]AFZ72605.1 hypothetical protein Natgr_1394 [Natronobacterium gregoryi SP2]ELY71967.1 hypothetical protein C490_04367 [Natronobacterium gregoryi SP2]PLK19205.1 hypothetical protein CYV19_16110 [Natronobacterium gregoryi SP2]SFJ57486.1 hypothetical protein SAMN05443661_14114 [Natronobacterium gregoryi]
MVRLLFGLLGALMALFPDGVREAYETAALEDPDASEPKPWLVSGIRAEGIVYALASTVGGKSYAWLLNVAGIAGVLAALFPKQYLETGAELAYEDADALEWRDGVVTAIRGIGALLVVLALLGARNRHNESAVARDGAKTDETETETGASE